MTTKEAKIEAFDPNSPGRQGNLFGLPFTPDEADLVIIPVPWEVTVSYSSGTAQGPLAVLHASAQVDLYVRDIEEAWKMGVAMLPFPHNLLEESHRLRHMAAPLIRQIEAGEHISADHPVLVKLNEACENLNIYVKTLAQKQLNAGKLVGLLGGDHSTPLGLLRAFSEHYERFGILQIDAHADLRKAYEGFTYSHASIMYNALKMPAVSRLVQVGIRDYCDEEIQIINRSMGRIVTFFDEELKEKQYAGATWDSLCDSIISELPEYVYISFDIDGLDPKLCPNTGTPVAGGLEFHQMTYLIKKLVKSGRKIIGFDLNEVAPGDSEWDANVGARALFHLCNWMGVSRGRLSAR